MRLKELRGLPVIDPTAARKVGTVVDYQVDPVAGRIAALDINSVEDGSGERILAQRIRRVGSSAVMLTARGGAIGGTTPDVNERWLDPATLNGLEVMGDDGNLIGRLVDATFDQDTLEVHDYLLSASFWERLIGRRGRIQPGKVHACSREIMLVNTGRVAETETPPAPEETTKPLEMRLPLKDADRVVAPTYKPVADGQPVSGRSR